MKQELRKIALEKRKNIIDRKSKEGKIIDFLNTIIKK